jgi:WD40 repeat protein
LVTASRSDGKARLWDAATGAEVRRFGGLSALCSVAFSPDGRWVLTASENTTARLWDAATGNWRATLLSYSNGGWAVVDPAGRYDASDPDDSPGLFFLAAGDMSFK